MVVGGTATKGIGKRGGGILPPRLLPCLLGWEAGRLRHELHDLANNFQLAPPANVEQLFSFDAGGSRARQIKTRAALTAANIRQIFTYKDLAGVSWNGKTQDILYIGFDNTVHFR